MNAPMMRSKLAKLCAASFSCCMLTAMAKERIMAKKLKKNSRYSYNELCLYSIFMEPRETTLLLLWGLWSYNYVILSKLLPSVIMLSYTHKPAKVTPKNAIQLKFLAITIRVSTLYVTPSSLTEQTAMMPISEARHWRTGIAMPCHPHLVTSSLLWISFLLRTNKSASSHPTE